MKLSSLVLNVYTIGGSSNSLIETDSKKRDMIFGPSHILKH